jgi:hypothetical protein
MTTATQTPSQPVWPEMVTRLDLDSLPDAWVTVAESGEDGWLSFAGQDGQHVTVHVSSPDAPLDRLVTAVQELQRRMRSLRKARDVDTFWAAAEEARRERGDTVPMLAITASPVEREAV